MNDDLFPRPDDPLERLVRARLDAQAARETADVWERAQRKRPWTGRAVRGLTAAAALLLASLTLTWGIGRAQATPAQAVARALEVHREDADHEYALRGEFAGLVREATLWTRGDRFRIEPAPGGKGAWGQDRDGSVWIAPTPAAGAVFRADEVPAGLQEMLAIRSVRLPVLLETVLKHCDLSRLPDAPQGIDRVEAVSQAGTLRRAVLDIDRDGLVRSLTLTRQLAVGEVTLALDLRGSASKDGAFYTLKGALAAHGEVFDSDRPVKRLGLLTRHRLGRR